jgi:putative peptidoglycan lipid II flippase
MAEDHPKTVSRSAVHFLSGTSISRVFGMLREMTMAYSFGAHPAIAAFMVSFRFANLLRRLLGEGSIASTFIPHFEAIRTDSSKKGAEFFRDLFASLTLFLILIILCIEVGLWCWLKWGGLNPENNHILFLTMLMLPGILFICQFGLGNALLQCERKYFLSGFAPVAFNVVWIVAAWQLKGVVGEKAAALLSIAVVIAFLMQWVMSVPYSFRFLRQSLSVKECFQAALFAPKIRALLVPFSLGIIGIGAEQINSALDAVFARFASLEGPAYLWYAIRLQQLPIALFGIALSSALLPPLSRAIQNNQTDTFKVLIGFSFTRAFSLIFPCLVGMIVLGAPAVNLLYGHGEFSQEATVQTTFCLWGYAAALLPSVFVLLLAPVFYAFKDYRTPATASLLSVILNVILNAIMVFGFHQGAFSIAIATSISACFNGLFLYSRLASRMGSTIQKPMLVSFFKTALCALIAGATTLFLGHYLIQDPSLSLLFGSEPQLFTREIPDQLIHFSVLAAAYGLIFFSYASMMNAEDILGLIGLKKLKP